MKHRRERRHARPAILLPRPPKRTTGRRPGEPPTARRTEPGPSPLALQAHQRVIVTCPAESVTGGPEALHQLVDALVGLGADAAMAYLAPAPGRAFAESVTTATIPDAYRHYRVPLWRAPLPDDGDTVIILPEVWSCAVDEFVAARVGLWWLSVDNNLVSGLGRFFQRPAPRRAPVHLYQSAYARAYLAVHGTAGEPLGDYLAAAHFAPTTETPRRRRVAFNPKKGFETTIQIIQRSLALGVEAEWVPIAGLDAAGVAALLATCRVYIDFGPHPGMDRLPREAALAGCCVVTGRQGAAAFAEDLPIPDLFKVPDANIDLAVARIAWCLDDPGASRAFDDYRRWIRSQRTRFFEQVVRLFHLAGGPALTTRPLASEIGA